MASVRPFTFAHLPRLTKQQVAVQQSLALYLSHRPLQPSFLHQVTGLVGQLLKAPCEVSAPETRAVVATDLPTLLPEVSCLIVLGVAPGEHKILVDLDGALAAFAIERLLGGDGEQARMQRPLTDIESGVLSFLLLKILSHLQEGWETGRELTVTLDRFVARLPEAAAVVDAEESFQQLGFKVAVGERRGYVRVLLPDALVTQRFATQVPQSGATPQEFAAMRRRLAALGEKQVLARLTVSRLDLQPADIANVEPGDIIVLENHQLTKTADGIEGDVFVTVGRGRNGGFVGRLRNDESQAEHAHLEVMKIVTQEQPQEEQAMAADEQDDNLQETEGLLRDVDASVVVELGRIRMNTAQVIRLRNGQILRLTRGPNDPVDLVVNGKLFARGELIEVEGELGVRLTQVAGSE